MKDDNKIAHTTLFAIQINCNYVSSMFLWCYLIIKHHTSWWRLILLFSSFYHRAIFYDVFLSLVLAFGELCRGKSAERPTGRYKILCFFIFPFISAKDEKVFLHTNREKFMIFQKIVWWKEKLQKIKWKLKRVLPFSLCHFVIAFS